MNHVPVSMAARPVTAAQMAWVDATRIETRILGVKKRKVDAIVRKASWVTVTEGICEGVLEVIQGIGAFFLKKRMFLKGSRFTKCFNIFRLPFCFLSGAVSFYSGVQDAAALRVAYREGDREALKDRGLNLGSNTTNLSASSVSASTSILKIKGINAGTVALSTAAASLMLTAFALYSVVKAISIGRICRAVKRMKVALAPENDLFEEKSDLLKYQQAMGDLYEQVGITQKEEVLLQTKTSDFNYGNSFISDFNYGNSFIKEADKLLRRKERKLARRVGKEMAGMIQKDAYNLLTELKSSDFKERSLALLAADSLLKKYKASLYRSLASRVMGCAAGVIGVIGGILAIANPVGMVVTTGVLIGIASGLIIYAYYGENYWKDSKFKEGLKCFNCTVSNFELPDVHSIIDQEIRDASGKILNAQKIVPFNEYNENLSPRVILDVMLKRNQFKKSA